jgi:glutamyl-tRNA(Gln) amidotransferase subunit E
MPSKPAKAQKEPEKPATRRQKAQVVYNTTRDAIGYVPRKQATQADYDRIGFMSGLEVHQQLKTRTKLFCRCPAGVFNKSDDYDAEVIRHMRPTLSELGEYDGTALMEFKTRKEIIYRIKHKTACTYEVDDTPPFPVDREALDISILISLLCKLNIVGEVHITRKQYLDGSIPTGFQRTAIIGVEGEIELKNKKIRLIQLSLEEDSCREISDIGHTRIYKTDRLGMPLIETVTYPDMINPDEVKEACDVIRFLNRSTGLVRTGIGAGREDVNVSCNGGTRVEIKGVAHTRWIPELTHNEAFRQWALLRLREKLLERIADTASWQPASEFLPYHFLNGLSYEPLKGAKKNKWKVLAINLPGFAGILSHFTQPGKSFADELRDRLKVIACLERPNMICSEDLLEDVEDGFMDKLAELFCAGPDDAQVVLWGPEEDMKTALETVEERCRMAFEGVPNETRKSLPDGTTIFERVLPGADRMYPDTDSPPIPLEDERIRELGSNLPQDFIHRYHQLKTWGVPEDTHTFIFSRNLFPLVERCINELDMDPVFTGTFFGHRVKWAEGRKKSQRGLSYDVIYALFRYLKQEKLHPELAYRMLPVIYENPKMDFESILNVLKFKRISQEDILANIPFLREKFRKIRVSPGDGAEGRWVMGQLWKMACGNMPLSQLREEVEA